MCSWKWQFLQLSGEIWVKILEKHLLRGLFLVKLQASSLMSKNITKIMHGWSLVINLFQWLTIQITFEKDSILCKLLVHIQNIFQVILSWLLYKKKKMFIFYRNIWSVSWAPKTRFATYFCHHYERKPWCVP